MLGRAVRRRMQQPFRLPAADRDTSAEERELDAMLAEAHAKAARRRTTTGLVLAALALLAVSPIVFMIGASILRSVTEARAARARRIDDRDRPLADAAVADARAALARRQEAFEAATSPSALDPLVPGRTPCPIRLQSPASQAAASYATYGSIDGNYYGSWPLTRLGTEPLRLGGGAAWTLDAFEEALRKGKAEKKELERVRLLATRDEGRDVLLRVEEERKPIGLAHGPDPSYISGSIAGRAYLYDHATEKVVCVADVDVTNSPAVDVRYVTRGILDTSARSTALDGALLRDLDTRLRTEISRAMRRAERIAAVEPVRGRARGPLTLR